MNQENVVRRISWSAVAVIITIATQACIGIWAAAQLDAQVSNNTEKLEAVRKDQQRILSEINAIHRTLDRNDIYARRSSYDTIITRH